MLSEETAMGNYPVETVQFMSEIASKAEELMAETRRITEPENDGTAEFLAYAACLLAQKANAKSIVAHSLSGTSARLLSARRPASGRQRQRGPSRPRRTFHRFVLAVRAR